jgi:hypothetical protein
MSRIAHPELLDRARRRLSEYLAAEAKGEESTRELRNNLDAWKHIVRELEREGRAR